MIIVIKKGIAVLLIGIIIVLIAIGFSGKSVPTASYCHENTKCIIIDPGHGIPDGGAVSKSGVTESPLNLQIAKKLGEELTERGFKVIFTREDENGLSKSKKTDMHMRLEMMNTTQADIFISIHMNKFSQSKYRGAEVLYSSNYVQSTLLAQLISEHITDIDPPNQTRGIKQAEKSLFLMKNATIPAVIVECGFLSNPAEEKLLLEPEYQARIASAVCDGILDYYKNVKNNENINIVKSEASS